MNKRLGESNWQGVLLSMKDLCNMKLKIFSLSLLSLDFLRAILLFLKSVALVNIFLFGFSIVFYCWVVSGEPCKLILEGWSFLNRQIILMIKTKLNQPVIITQSCTVSLFTRLKVDCFLFNHPCPNCKYKHNIPSNDSYRDREYYVVLLPS